MKPAHKDRFRISEEAALWLVRLEDEGSPEVRAQFTAWARQSPIHVEEFLFAQATSRHMAGMDPERRIDLSVMESGNEDVISIVRNEGAGIAPDRFPPEKRGKRRWGLTSALAASIAIAVGVWFVFIAGPQSYTTAVGDQQAIKLPDGSVMHLNTASRARVEFDAAGRTIHLLSGEALFVVERDPARPFRVLAGEAAIQALGTQFNVYRRDTGTQVSVLEGAVRVDSKDVSGGPSLELSAGDEARVAGGGPVRIAAPDVQRAVSWRARKLMFQSDPLEDVAREFNRYDSRRPLRLEGEAIRRRVISGVFDADDPRPLIEFLEEDPALQVEQTDQEILIRLR